MKLFTCVVERCTSCPNYDSHWDEIMERWTKPFCRGVEDCIPLSTAAYATIPDWCPLPDYTGSHGEET